MKRLSVEKNLGRSLSKRNQNSVKSPLGLFQRVEVGGGKKEKTLFLSRGEGAGGMGVMNKVGIYGRIIYHAMSKPSPFISGTSRYEQTFSIH